MVVESVLFEINAELSVLPLLTAAKVKIACRGPLQIQSCLEIEMETKTLAKLNENFSDAE